MGGKSSSSSESGPWAGVQPYLQDVYGQANSLYNKGTPAYYPGQTYTGFNPIQDQAMDATMGRASGSPTESAMGRMLTGELSQPRVSMAGAQGTANQAMTGFAGGMNTVQRQTPAMGTSNARHYADQGAHGWNNALWKQSQYNGSARPTSGSSTANWGLNRAMSERGPSVRLGPGFANNALARNSNGMSMGAANNQSGASRSLNATAKSRLQNLSDGNNPYLDDMAKAATDSVREQFSESVMPSINATFGMGGRSGSRAHTDTVAKASEGLADTISNMTADIYGSNYQSDMDRRLSAADSLGGLEVSEFNANSSDDLARRGLASDLYLGSQGLANDAAGTALSDNLNRNSLNVQQGIADRNRNLSAANSINDDLNTRTSMGQDYDLNRRSLSQDAATTGMSSQIARNNLMQDWYNSDADRSLRAGGMLMDAGLGAIDDTTNMYGAQTGAMLGAGSQVGNLSNMEWNNIDRMRGVGDDVQGLSQAMVDDDRARFDYYQNAPYDMLNWYAGIVGDNAAMSTRNKGSGFNLSGGLLGFL